MSSGLYSGASGIALGVGLYRQVAGLWGGASGLVSGFGNPIPPLFAGGAAGAWFDFTDTSTWYQDAAGTTPAATLGDVVGLVLDKSRGASFAARRNYLNYTQDFSNADWVKTTCTVTASATTAPDGTSTGTLLTQTGSGGRAVQTVTVAAGVFTYSIYVKKFGAVDNIGVILRNGTTATNYGTIWRFSTLDFAGSGPNLTTSYTDVGGGWYRLSLRADTAFSAGDSALIYIYAGGTSTTADSVYAWGAQLELGAATTYQACTTVPVTWLGNHASQATTAQKPLRARIPLGGRRNMASNTAWGGAVSGTPGTAPTGWTFVTSGGTLTVTTISAGENSLAFAATAARHMFAQDVAVAASTTYATSVVVLTNPDNLVLNQLVLSATGPAGYSATYYANNVLVNGATYVPIAGDVIGFVAIIAATAGNISFRIGIGCSGNVTGSVSLRSPQFERGALATAYQKVVADWDVTESGVTSIPALYYDGSDDSLATAAIDFTTCTSDGAARRNLLTFPSVFNDAAWSLDNGGATNPIVTANAGTSPIGTADADRIVLNKTGGTFSRIQQSAVSTVSSTYVFSVWLKKYTSGTANVGIRIETNGQQCVVTETWQRFSISVVATVTSVAGQILLFDSISGNDETADILAWGAQLELGSTATAFQDIGTDKMTVFAGVENLTNATQAIVAELSATIASNNGSFAMSVAPAAANVVRFSGKGTTQTNADSAATFIAPYSAVITGIDDISGDSNRLRVNGAEQTPNTGDQGTGNFGNYALYLGRRGGASAPFKGYMIGHMVIVGKLANASEIAAVEATERAATGAY